MKDIRYLVIHSPGPRWLAGKSLFEQPGLESSGLLNVEVRQRLVGMKK